MAQNITLLNASYSDVPAVTLPKTGGGTAKFTDVTPTTATDADVASGKIYFKADGTQSTGTYEGSGGGGGVVTPKQINFIDYDGTVLYAYTKAEINAMASESDLPANPSHTGLTAQGWNWTLAQIKAQLTAAPDGDVWVGQMYVTSSGDTEIDVSMPYGRLSPILTICVNGTVTVDWGDNTTPDTVTGTSVTSRLDVPHTYASEGDYTISIHKVSGKYAFYNSSSYLLLRKDAIANNSRVYANCIQNVRVGSGITSIGDYAFYFCCSLANITIPDSVTSIGSYAFRSCYALTSITIPDGVTSIGNYAFQYCYALTSVTIPDGVTSMGSYAFQYCYTLTSVTIPDSVTSTGDYTFASCYALTSVTIPDGVTSIGTYAFEYCYALTSITIPDGVTSIGNYAFRSCYSLTRITVPDDVTTIGSNSTFAGCYGMAEYHILPTTPPTVGASTFNNIPSDCIIYVPSASLTTYKTASQWSNYASYMVGE